MLFSSKSITLRIAIDSLQGTEINLYEINYLRRVYSTFYLRREARRVQARFFFFFFKIAARYHINLPEWSTLLKAQVHGFFSL